MRTSARVQLATLWVGHLLSAASLTMLAPLLPLYLARLGLHDPASHAIWSGAALAAPALSYIFIAPCWGTLSDRLGARSMVLRAALGLGIILSLMAVARTPLELVVLRLGQGAFGGVIDAGLVYATTLGDETRRGRVFGFLVTASAAGAVLGPLLGGGAIDAFGFRLVLSVAAVFMMLWAGAAWQILPFQPPRARSSAAAPLGRRFGRVQNVGSPGAYLLAGFCANVGLYGNVAVFATLVVDTCAGADRMATWVGGLQAATGLAAIVGAPWWGRRNDRPTGARTVAWAPLGCSTSLLVQAMAPHLMAFVAARLALGFCYCAITQTVLWRVVNEASESKRGARLAAANRVLTCGQIVGGGLGGWLGAWVGAGGVCLLMSVPFTLSAVLFWHATKDQSRPAPRAG
jgi:MFS transporter, DHA1 family, staphyloferrin B biosynthesis exporter